MKAKRILKLKRARAAAKEAPRRNGRIIQEDPRKAVLDRAYQQQVQHIDTNLWRVDWKRLGFDFCCVYLIGPERRWPMKIGVSVAPAKRLSGIQTSIWEPLQVHGLYFANDAAEAREVEQAAHHALRDSGKALLGEWFDARPDDAADAVEFGALIAGVEISKAPPCGLNHPLVQQEMKKIFLRAHRGGMSACEHQHDRLWSRPNRVEGIA